jgi:hypothetical protein
MNFVLPESPGSRKFSLKWSEEDTEEGSFVLQCAREVLPLSHLLSSPGDLPPVG